MKKWNELLEYIDYYIYFEEEECAIISYGQNSEQADLLYHEIIDSFHSEDVETEKWEFDIALDCVRLMSDEDRKYVSRHLRTIEYHFGYAMHIRNKYIHTAAIHETWDDDFTSTSVMENIMTILNPHYDCHNEMMKLFFREYAYEGLESCYLDKYPELFEEALIKLENCHSEEDEKTLFSRFKEQLKKAQGDDGFVTALCAFAEDIKSIEIDLQAHMQFKNVLFDYMTLYYPLEYNQISCLDDIGLFRAINKREVCSIAECERYIADNLGLREDYVKVLAKAVWKAFAPISE